MSLAVGDIHRVRCFCQLGEQISQNTFHFRVQTAPIPGAPEQDIADAYQALFVVLYPAILPVAATYIGLLYSRVLPTKTNAFASPNGAAIGVKTGDILPRQCAAVSTLFDGQPTRKGRGRIYWPFPVESFNDPTGVPAAAYTGQLTGFTASFLGMNLVDQTPQIIANVWLAIFHKAAGGTASLVTSHRTNTIWGTQRRRGSYGRPNVRPQGL